MLSRKQAITWLVIAVSAMSLATLWQAPAAFSAEPGLVNLSLEDLMNVQVTSVSRKAEKAYDTAAAVYVITAEDIRRSGATSIVEALRMTPGVEVDRIDGSRWAVSSRGFTDRFANKLLVLVDGRSVYTALFSGVFWDAQQLLLEDINRIEVIRGPGATVWGANAVNGVINIITKDTSATEGTLLKTATDSVIPQSGSFRFGGHLENGARFRVYAQGFDESPLDSSGGQPAFDNWTQRFGGFRADWDMSGGASLLMEGQSYSARAHAGQVVPSGVVDDAINTAGTNGLVRWSKASARSDLSAQVYFDHTNRTDTTMYTELRDTTDFDLQHRFSPSPKHEIVWGLGYRISSDSTQGSPIISYSPESRTDRLVSGFIQDEITLKKDRLHLMLGSKFERNGYTGNETQPNIRLLWTPDTKRTGWLALSRAARTPCRTEADGHVLFGSTEVNIPGLGDVTLPVYLVGNPDYGSEVLTAYEAGYRVIPSSRLSLDVAAFYNIYNDFRAFQQVGVQGVPGNLWFEITPENLMTAKTWGGEIVSNYAVTDHWRLSASYSRLRVDVIPGADARDPMTMGYEASSPQNQFRLRSYMDLPHNMEFDVLGYYVGAYDSPHVPNKSPNIPRYLRLDMRLGWKPISTTEVSVGVQNLLQDQHIEFGTSRGEVPTAIPRSVYANVKYQF